MRRIFSISTDKTIFWLFIFYIFLYFIYLFLIIIFAGNEQRWTYAAGRYAVFGIDYKAVKDVENSANV